MGDFVGVIGCAEREKTELIDNPNLNTDMSRTFVGAGTVGSFSEAIDRMVASEMRVLV